MAEERLIDEDKDKKYRFRLNADGEEELVVDGGDDAPSAPEEAELSFDAEQDEPEEDEIEAAKRFAAEQAEALAGLLDRTREEMSAGRYSTALEFLSEAGEISPEDGDVAALELAVYTRELTDFSEGALGDAVAAAGRVAEFSSAERKAELKEMGADRLGGMISALESEERSLGEQNERKKAERAEIFNADNRRARVRFLCAAAALLVFAAPAIFFSTIMFSDTSGTFIVLTAVFGALALIALGFCGFTGRGYIVTSRRVRMNRDNSRSQLGRDYEKCRRRLDALRTIYNALSD